MNNSGSALKILIIDDDEIVRISACTLFTRHGYKVILAEDGNEGIEKFKSEHPDITLTDIIMPEKEGLETIAEIRRIDPQARIIAISGGGMMRKTSFLTLALKIGADKTLTKPLKPSELLSTVQDLMPS